MTLFRGSNYLFFYCYKSWKQLKPFFQTCTKLFLFPFSGFFYNSDDFLAISRTFSFLKSFRFDKKSILPQNSHPKSFQPQIDHIVLYLLIDFIRPEVLAVRLLAFFEVIRRRPLLLLVNFPVRQ